MFRALWTAPLTLLLTGFFGTPGSAQDAPKPIRALLVIGGCCHDYAKQKDIITNGVSARARVQWTIAYDSNTTKEHLNPVYNSADWAKGFDVIVHDECSGGVTDLTMINRILEPHRQGLPAVLIHCGEHAYKSEGFPKLTPWTEFTGVISTGHGPQEPISVTFDKDSPITKGQKDWKTIKEELYNNGVVGKLEATTKPLAHRHTDGKG